MCLIHLTFTRLKLAVIFGVAITHTCQISIPFTPHREPYPQQGTPQDLQTGPLRRETEREDAPGKEPLLQEALAEPLVVPA